MRETIIIDERDNVATALAPLPAGSTHDVGLADGKIAVSVTQDIPYGHKFALSAIPKGAPVLKYGAEIGNATADIGVGEHVHTHNITSRRFRGDVLAG